MPETVTDQSVHMLLGRLVESNEQIHKRLDKIDGRLDRIDGRLDNVEGRLAKVESSLNAAKVSIKVAGTIGSILWAAFTFIVLYFGRR